MPISSEIGVRVQGSISRTCNYPGGSGKGFPLVESLVSYNGSDRGTFGELSLGEYIGLEYGAELGSYSDISCGEVGSSVRR